MHALTIFIQCPYHQATLLAKDRTQQSARFKLANQGLDLGKTTPPVNHSHFTHCYSATLNPKQEQGALLRRILLTREYAADVPAHGVVMLRVIPHHE
jgi:hypothetical protein